MKNIGVRVVSATSILPVSAFAAGEGTPDAEPGVAVQEEDASTVTYTLSGSCNNQTINMPGKDVIINITGNVTSATGKGILLRVVTAKNLTINGTGYEVDAGSGTFITVQDMEFDGKLTIEGGTYKSTGIVLQLMENESSTNSYSVVLNHVTIEAGNIAVANQNKNAAVNIHGGKYSNSFQNAVLLNNGVLTVDGNAVVESANGIAVQNNAGTVTFKNGRYTSAGTTVFTGKDAETDVSGGTSTRTDADGRAYKKAKGGCTGCSRLSAVLSYIQTCPKMVAL